MRRISMVVFVMTISLMLAMPAQAKPADGGRWFERRIDPIVKVIKKFVIRTFGDGLSDPRP